MRTPARRTLQALLVALGTATVGIGLLHVLFGPAIIRGSIPVNATMDSEDRFFGAIFLAYGVALLWCAVDVDRKLTQVKLAALAFFAGGLARLVSMAATGLPAPFFIAMTAVELLLPGILVWLAVYVEANGPQAARQYPDSPDRIKVKGKTGF